MLYFDHAASTPMPGEIRQLLSESLERDFANPAASHRLGRELNAKMQECRTWFLNALGKKRGQIIFTSSATESNNMVVKGLGALATVHVDADSHASLTAPAKTVKLQETGTKLALLSWVNGQSGKISDLEQQIKQLRSEHTRIHIHVDAVQGFGKIPGNLNNVDSIALSSHKIGGPKGVALLWIDEGVKLSPLLEGGGHEDGLRSSTPAAPLIFAFQAAAKKSLERQAESLEQIKQLNLRLRTELLSISPQIRFPFESSQTSPYILMLVIPQIPSDIVLRFLEERHVYLSSTSACSSRQKGDNPIFSAMGLPLSEHKHVLRISLGQETSAVEVDQLLQNFSQVLEALSFYKK
jgi:cysteine desulfurase